jgi:hypothetical protein
MKSSQRARAAREAVDATPDVARTRQADAAPRGEDEIRIRAYQLYAERKGLGGDAVSDWLAAECEQREGGRRGPEDAASTVGTGGTP